MRVLKPAQHPCHPAMVQKLPNATLPKGAPVVVPVKVPEGVDPLSVGPTVAETRRATGDQEKDPPKKSFFKQLEKDNPRQDGEERRDYRLRVLNLLKEAQKDQKAKKTSGKPKAVAKAKLRAAIPGDTREADSLRQVRLRARDNLDGEPLTEGEPIQTPTVRLTLRQPDTPPPWPGIYAKGGKGQSKAAPKGGDRERDFQREQDLPQKRRGHSQERDRAKARGIWDTGKISSKFAKNTYAKKNKGQNRGRKDRWQK